MRTDQQLPVRPAIWDGEALSGYAVRLADANGLHSRSLVPPGYADATAPPGMVARLAAAAGATPEQIHAMTLAPMPPSVRGRGQLQRHGWRLHQDVSWVCPVCTHATGYRALLWRLGTLPVCTRCEVLLVQAHDILKARPAPTHLLELTAQLTELVHAATARNPGARTKLSSYRKVCAAVALTLDHQWPPRPAGLPRADLSAARTWGPHPCPDPTTTATVLLAAQPALGSTRTRERFTTQVLARLERVRSTPAPGSARNPVRLPRTPRPENRPPLLPGFDNRDQGRLAQLMKDLRAMVSATGLQPRHVPGFLLLPGDDPIPPGAARRDRWLGAIGLHMLISRAHGEIGAASTACRDLGTSDTETNPFLDGLRLHRGIHPEHDQLLRAGARTLLAEGLVDYRRRRQGLRHARRLPSLALATGRLPDIGHVPGHRLALGWMWVHLTRGPMWTSPFPSIYTSTVMNFDAAIDPETRLHLHDAGLALIDGPDFTPALLLGGEARAAARGRRTG